MKAKRKLLCIFVSMVLILGGIMAYKSWMQKKMIENVRRYAETAGLKEIIIEVSEYNKHQLFLDSDNFTEIEWEKLFSMNEKILNVTGVEKITYFQNHVLYNIDQEGNIIYASGNSDYKVSFSGSWDNASKHYYPNSSQIKEDLERRKIDTEITSINSCEVSNCGKEGTKVIIGISGSQEYYCEEHYLEMGEFLENILK